MFFQSLSVWNLIFGFVVYTVKDKDKEALFNVAYNVTDNISSWAILHITIISLTDTYMYLSLSS